MCGLWCNFFHFSILTVKKMGISNRLQEERKRLGLTQQALAEKLGATKRSVINWEGGVASPSADTLTQYASVGVDVLYVLTGLKADAHLRLALLDKSMSIASEQADTFTEVKSLGTEMRNTMLRHTATTDDECEMLALYRKASKDVKTAALGALRAGTET